MQKFKCYIFFLLLLLTGICLQAQSDMASATTPVNPSRLNTNSAIDTFFVNHHIEDLKDSILVIRKILIEGNKTTRRVIMLRELPFKEGDTIQARDLPEIFKIGQKQLMNLQLFHNASLDIVSVEANTVDLKITVKERWYLFPLPYFKPVDRNLNQWLFEKGASVSRLDYGVKVLWGNVTRNNDKLNFYFVTGYTKQLLISYRRPFIDKGMRWGAKIDLALGKNREINYNTIDDKQAFLKNGDYLKNFFRSNLEITYRKELYTKHAFGLGYQTLNVKDTVLKLNPNYLFNGETSIGYPTIYYTLSYQNLDYIPYPTKGYTGEVHISKQGFNKDMNLWQLRAKGMGSWHLWRNSFYNIGVLGAIKLPFHQPFYNKQLLGYGDMFLRGYEYYVVDGVAGGLINASLVQRLTNFSFHIPRTKWLTPRLIPLKIYGKIFGNMGYVYDPDPSPNRLPRKLLFGGGIGLDIFTMYDFTLNVEFSFNQLGQNGLYLHKKDMF